ncbi:hypothetical protein BH23ACI1_BH23ACI1_15150 [soil metagenome]|nr:hypothetical protein [Acidobacteriota bacterium]
MSARPRILVASADKSECDAISDWLLSDGLDPIPANGLTPAVRQLERAPFDAIIVAAEFAFSDVLRTTRRARQGRAPVIVLTADSTAEASAERFGFLSVGRPVERAMVMCSITMALVESRPVRRSARKPVVELEAVVQGMPAALVDVSPEGMRLHLPRDHRRALPPVFTVRVPMVGIGLSVQRCWLDTSVNHRTPQVAVCGVSLYDNAAVREQGWRRFVDVLPTRA